MTLNPIDDEALLDAELDPELGIGDEDKRVVGD